MKKKIWIFAVSIAIVVLAYFGSFFLVLFGQRLAHIEIADDMGLGYVLDYEQGPDGLSFPDNPWMRVYSPLSSSIYRNSNNPKEKVALSFYGKIVYSAWSWGWDGYSMSDAWVEAKSVRGWTYEEWFPERFERDIRSKGE